MKLHGTHTTVAAAAILYITSTLVDLRLDKPSLSKNDFPTVFHLKLGAFRFNNCTDIVHYEPFLLSLSMVETGRPSFKRFKAEGERVLPRRKSIALIHQHFILSKRIPGLKVVHLIARIVNPDIFRSMIIVPVRL